jgi:SAM-dependent methyltransferase
VHANSRLLFQKYAASYFPAGGRVLEIGPDGFPSAFQAAVNGRGGMTWETLDMFQDARLTHVATSEYSFPVADESYDVVVSGNVLEHVRKIWVWMRELARVCKVGGVVITLNPVSWPYHEAPIDCWRAYPEGMKALYEDASLQVILSHWESLEALGFRRYTPGASPEHQSRPLRLALRVLGRLGFPVERSYDTITIGRKLPPGAPAGTGPGADPARR